MLGLLAATGFLSSLVNAAVYWKQISRCEWYGEDIEVKSLPPFGGGGALASAYFHVCDPTYWHDGKNDGWVFDLAELLFVWVHNDIYTIRTTTYFSVLGAIMSVTASVGYPPGSA